MQYQKDTYSLTRYIHNIYIYIWVNYNNSLTWNKAIWGWFPLLTMIPMRSQWGRYNLPRYIYNTYTHIYIYIRCIPMLFSCSHPPPPPDIWHPTGWSPSRSASSVEMQQLRNGNPLGSWAPLYHQAYQVRTTGGSFSFSHSWSSF